MEEGIEGGSKDCRKKGLTEERIDGRKDCGKKGFTEERVIGRKD
jgi:hypothetical protein